VVNKGLQQSLQMNAIFPKYYNLYGTINSLNYQREVIKYNTKNNNTFPSSDPIDLSK